jgi:MFS family permease
MAETTTEQVVTAPAAPPVSAFGRTFWMLNVIEMFERLAYFGIRAVVPLYIMQATEPGGLHLTAVHKGWIYMWWAILQSWLPMFTGGIADRYGYKRVLFFAISANVVGYLVMAGLHNYYGFFIGILVLASGTAFFKPALQGSIAQNLTKANSSMGWGIFYWVVNVGAVMAPIIATAILGKPHSAEGWRNLFIASAVYTAINLLVLLTFRDVPSGAEKSLSLMQVFGRTVENIWPYWFVGGRMHPIRGPLGIVLATVGLVAVILAELFSGWTGVGERVFTFGGLGLFLAGAALATILAGGAFQWQLRLPAFLLIMSCFWLMMYQLWDLHPNFITDWVDSSGVAQYAPQAWREYGDRGLLQVPQQILLNLNAALIVALVVVVSWLSRKMRALSAMLIGMSVATVGILVAGLTSSGWILLLGIVFFSLGEMLTGPKKNEYLGLIAPPGKKGLYLGYVNIPVGIGVGIGSMIAGVLYDNYGEKATLALKELGARPQLVAEAVRAVDWSDSLGELPRMLGIEPKDAFAAARQELSGSDEEAAAALRQHYRYDHGQTVNLAYVWLAENEPTAKARFAAKRPGSEAVPAAHIANLPKWLEIKRSEALELVRQALKTDPNSAGQLADSEISAMLWDKYGGDPAVLNILALEYLAQGTQKLSAAATAALAQQPLKEPVAELGKRFGIDRTKAFDALSVALGASAADLDRILDAHAAGNDQTDRLYVYLASQPHVRFNAVAKRDWSKDVPLLREMLESDPAAKKIAEERINEKTVTESIVSGLTKLFGGQEPTDLYARLAPKQYLVQAALAAKNWSAHPDHARRLLAMSTFEARARATVEAGNSGLRATQLLWDTYDPQYRVWVPFAAIGVLATIALGIFGQMAKRWKDMNA